jgi:hypothetical protein
MVSEAIPREWLLDDEPVELPNFEGESPELREWRMVVAFLNNC